VSPTSQVAPHRLGGKSIFSAVAERWRPAGPTGSLSLSRREVRETGFGDTLRPVCETPGGTPVTNPATSGNGVGPIRPEVLAPPPPTLERPDGEVYSHTSSVGRAVRSQSRRPGRGIGRVIPIAIALLALLSVNVVAFGAPLSSAAPPVGHLRTLAGTPIRDPPRGPEAGLARESNRATPHPAASLSVRGPTFEPNPAAVDHRFLIEAHATGGQPPYQYRYSGLPPGCTSQNLSVLPCRANATGNYTIGVNVTDSAGSNATSAATLRVNLDNSFYEETWQASGLGSGGQWGVSIYGTNYTTTSQQLNLYLSPGYYPFTVLAPPGYSATPANGSLVVNTSFLTIDIAFARPLYSVTFLQSALPAGTPWSVTADGQTADSTSARAALKLPNGTVSYLVSPPTLWRAVPPGGNLTVAGAPTTVDITFVAIPTYAVSFTASDLPPESVWGVDVYGRTVTSALSNLSTLEPNGTYPFFVRPPTGWTASPDQGNVTVQGQAVGQSISFAFYRLTLHETGLPQGTSWSALVNGSLLSGTTANLTEGLPPGTYGFGVTAIAGWTATPSVGSIVVGPGLSGLAEVTFVGPVERSNVTFFGSGLPSNLTWSIVVDGLTEPAGVSGLSLPLANGTYPFAVNAPTGWVASPSNGTVVVVGKPVSVSIAFALPAPLTGSWIGTDPQAWVTFSAALGGCVVAGLVAGVAVVRLRTPRG
jgi:hypothetical protein